MRPTALLALAAIAGCGSGDPTATICKKAGGLCAQLDANDVQECTRDLREAKLPKDALAKTANCAKDAESCPELVACFAFIGRAVLDDLAKDDSEGDEPAPESDKPDRPGGCAGFNRPTADCTNGSCSFDDDCPAPQKCNDSVDRCFDPARPCAGTPCTFDDDCSTGERCNRATETCFRTADSQTCMPCMTDRDCGATRCGGDTCQ